MTEKPLAGRTAVITGASRGLGRAIAIAMAKAGASLALLGRDAAELGITESEVKQFGVAARYFVGDLADEYQVRRLEREVIDHFKAVDILVNNAGMTLRKTLLDFSLDEWNQVLRTNLTGAFLMCRAFVPHMKGRGYGRVINITTMLTEVALPMRSAYCASKGGLLAMSRVLALELAPEKINVVCIAPGPFATEMTVSMMNDPEVQRNFTPRIPLGRWGKPQEIGELATFLCSDGAAFITGIQIVVDGGWSAQ